MKSIQKEVTFLSLVIQHNRETPPAAQGWADAKNNLLYAPSRFGESLTRNISHAVNGMRVFKENGRDYGL